ncbi:unnamed protein product [Nezara viridula]|uniref:G-protein coupled receptors family 2 profile 2 domain-containing protein n=1 Tax=Nezara viridula TaxID=85310 RepID=A0A9P0EAR7_NEZVI|nr:unnamed protein product [Nezara viridula]
MKHNRANKRSDQLCQDIMTNEDAKSIGFLDHVRHCDVAKLLINHTVMGSNPTGSSGRNAWRAVVGKEREKWAGPTTQPVMAQRCFNFIGNCILGHHLRVLRNNRTKIHKNLFIAMVAQVVIRLTLYIDQAIIRSKTTKTQGIDNTPILCEASYVLLEYARTAMFMWMFIEGLYLHNVVTVRVFQETFRYRLYNCVGWGLPLVMTTAWAASIASKMKTKCWWGYNLTPYFWILEGPRFAVILLNFLFLLNIIRVLIVKLRESHTSEVERVRKAVRAAVVLLPLLGITNIVNMMEAPLDRQVWEFAVWSYTTHFLTSFQGLFVAVLYCFLNGEVRTAIRKSIYTYLSLRPHQFTPRRNSAYVSVGSTRPPEPQPETRV